MVLASFCPFPKPARQAKKRAKNTVSADWRLYLYMLLFLYVGMDRLLRLAGTICRTSTLDPQQPSVAVRTLDRHDRRPLLVSVRPFADKSDFLLLEARPFLAALLLIRQPACIFCAAVFARDCLSGFLRLVIVTHHLWRIAVASGLIMGLGGIGASLMPLLAGVFAASQGIVAGLWALFTAALCLLALTVVNALFPHR